MNADSARGSEDKMLCVSPGRSSSCLPTQKPSDSQTVPERRIFFFFSHPNFSMQDLITAPNVCRHGFGKTILLGGSKYENRKKAAATD